MESTQELSADQEVIRLRNRVQELERRAWYSSSRAIKTQTTGLLMILGEYLQNARDAGEQAARTGTFTAHFSPGRFSFSHDLGIWSESDIASVFAPGISSKDRMRHMVGEMGIGSLSPFALADRVSVYAPTQDGGRGLGRKSPPQRKKS